MEGDLKEQEQFMMGFCFLAVETFFFIVIDSNADHDHCVTNVLYWVVAISLSIGWFWLLKILLDIASRKASQLNIPASGGKDKQPMRRTKTIVMDGVFDFSVAWKMHFGDSGLDSLWINATGPGEDDQSTWRDGVGNPAVNDQGSPSRPTLFDEAMHQEPFPTTGTGVIRFQAHIIHLGFWLSTRRVLKEHFAPKGISRPGFQHIFSVIKEGRLRRFDFRVVILLPPPPDATSPSGRWEGDCRVPVLEFSRYGCQASEPSRCHLGIESGGEDSGLWTSSHRFLGVI